MESYGITEIIRKTCRPCYHDLDERSASYPALMRPARAVRPA